MARYGFATLLGDYPVGYEFTPSDIPLHLTHVDSFEVDLNHEELTLKLGQALVGQRAFSAEAIADTFLGPNKDIPVTMLELTPELANLHRAIMAMLEREVAILKNPQFHRNGFGPHITIYGTRRIALGDKVPIKDVSIGIKTEDGTNTVHRIISTITLAK